MKYILLLLLALNLHAKVIDIYTSNILGKTPIERGDTIIIDYSHHLAGTSLPVDIIYCRSLDCRKQAITRLQYKYRTNGITVIVVK